MSSPIDAPFVAVRLEPPVGTDQSRAAFGSAVATDGQHVVVGAPLADVGLTQADTHDRGLVHVFTGAALDWEEAQRLEATDLGFEHGAFGRSLAIDGDTLVVGAPLAVVEDHPQAGFAVVFEHQAGEDGDRFRRTGVLRSDEAHTGIELGAGVAASRRMVVVSAPHLPQPGSQDSQAPLRGGAVLTWERGPQLRPGRSDHTEATALDDQVSSWQPGPRLGPAPSLDGLGEHLALFGTRLLLGHDGADATRTLASVWNLEAQDFTLAHRLALPAPMAARLGRGPRPVALDRDLAVVGLPDTAVGSVDGVGAVALFTRTDRGWSEATLFELPDQPRAGAHFGHAVAVAKDRVVVGAPGMPDGTRRTGAVYVLRRGDQGWRLAHRYFPPVAGDQDEGRALGFGSALATAGRLIVVGAPGYDDTDKPQTRDVGAAWVLTVQD